MGDASDDVFQESLRESHVAIEMYMAGCRRCPNLHDEKECLVCHDLGWLDRNGEPCEP